MRYSLVDFEDDLDGAIIERGEQYWRRGRVRELSEIDRDVWSALVQGSEAYEVRVTIADGVVTRWSCTCPYDLGPVCKHVVAVLYAMRGQLHGDNRKAESRVRTPVRPTRGNRRERAGVDDLDAVLSAIPHDDLTAFVRQYAAEDDVFRAALLARGLTRIDGDRQVFRRVIRTAIRAAAGREGFVAWDAGYEAMRGATEILEQAERALAAGGAARAVAMCLAVVEECVPALQYADDSNGEISEPIERAFDLLERATRDIGKGRNPSVVRSTFDEITALAQHQMFDGWDWNWTLLRAAIPLAADDAMTRQLRQVIERSRTERAKRHAEQYGERHGPRDEDFWTRYEDEEAAVITLALLRHRQQTAEAERYLTDHLQFPAMRREAIARAIAARAWDRVRALAEEGIAQDRKHSPGYATEWTERLLDIAEQQRDIDAIHCHARELFLASGDFKFYEQLRKTYAPTEWPSQYRELANAVLRDQRRGGGAYTLARMCEREQDWDQLMEVVERHTDRHFVMEYRHVLATRYPERLVRAYTRVIRGELAQTTSRAHYQETCRLLRQVRKVNPDAADALVAEFKFAYPKRRALLEELDRT